MKQRELALAKQRTEELQRELLLLKKKTDELEATKLEVADWQQKFHDMEKQLKADRAASDETIQGLATKYESLEKVVLERSREILGKNHWFLFPCCSLASPRV